MVSTKSTLPKILFVDDEISLLDGLKRQLRNNFAIEIAVGGEVALSVIREHGQIAVVVSDMRMPGMDGAEFLQRLKSISPDTVRLMLTGNADQTSAVRAVNEGNIFRFLNKPCSIPDLVKAIEDALTQYRLVTAEKDLLQNTLSGSVKLLTDVLAFTDPTIFGQSMKLRQSVQRLLPALGITNSWEIELAAMLSNIGMVTVPSAVSLKMRRKIPLASNELEAINKVPSIGHSLIGNIPRLQGVAKIVLYQEKHFDGTGLPDDNVQGEDIPIGARIIKILKDYLGLQAENLPETQIIARLMGRLGYYDSSLLASTIKVLANNTSGEAPETKIFEIKSRQLFLGQTLLSNVETKDGVLLISAGAVVTETVLARLINYSKLVGIKEPILVDCLMPAVAQ